MKNFLIISALLMIIFTLLALKHQVETRYFPQPEKPVPIEQKQEDAINTARAKMIRNQFHPYYGYHINLVRELKPRLRNPDSFQHIETTFDDAGQYLYVQMTYRAQNGFGGMGLYIVVARANVLTGKIIEISEQ